MSSKFYYKRREGRGVTWEDYFMAICDTIATKSKCLSRQIGAVIVKDGAILSTGYNGPPRRYPHCEGEVCPRHLKGYKSGEGLEECPAAHAERNAICQAARNGTAVNGAILFLNTITPCKACMAEIINAGIIAVVYKTEGHYDSLGLKMAQECGIDLIHYRGSG